MRRTLVVATTAALIASLAIAATPAYAAEPLWETPAALSDAEGGAWGHQILHHGDAFVAAWTQYTVDENYVAVSRSTDSGATWSDAIRISGAGEAATDLQIASHGSTIVAIWKRFNSDTNQWDLVSTQSTDGGVTWSQTPSFIASEVPNDSLYATSIVTDGTTITASWQYGASLPDDGYTTEFWTAASSDGGATWSTPARIVADPAAGGFTVVASGPVRVATWDVYEIVDDVYYSTVFTARSTDGGATWSSPEAVSATDGDISSPRVVTAGSAIVIVWNNGPRVESIRSTNGGVTWSAPVTISGGDAAFTLLGSLWSDGTNILVGYNPHDGDGYEGMRVARSIDGGATWASSAVVQTGDVLWPTFSTTGSTITAAWVQYIEFGDEMALGKSAIQVSRSTDGGATWSAPTALTGSDREASRPLSASSASHTAVVWSAQASMEDGSVIMVSADTAVAKLAATGGSDVLPLGALALLLLGLGAATVTAQRRRVQTRP